MNSFQKRKRVEKAYSKMYGRNIYSQDVNKRECAAEPYRDGKYYSDCSSSTRIAYQKADIGLDYIGGNTADIYANNIKNIVKVTIRKDGTIKNADVVLRRGDLLMFAGTDEKRPLTIGHVEHVASISKEKVILGGHGSDHPSIKDCDEYCKMRQSTKASTKRGNRGLVCVLRPIQDEYVKSTYKNGTRIFSGRKTIGKIPFGKKAVLLKKGLVRSTVVYGNVKGQARNKWLSF